MAERPGYLVNPINLFRGSIPFEGEFDVDWFCKIPSESAARLRLDFLRTPKNIFELRNRGYGGPALNRMWREVFRACAGFGVPVHTELRHLASELGVILPPE